jgi:predicted peroxiredoxin
LSQEKDKIVLMCTHGPEDAERATIPFVLATAAQALDTEAVIGLQVEGVRLAVKGVADDVAAPSFLPLRQLLDSYLESGGQLLVCGPCVKSRNLNPEDFVTGATIVTAGVFMSEITEASNVLVY